MRNKNKLLAIVFALLMTIVGAVQAQSFTVNPRSGPISFSGANGLTATGIVLASGDQVVVTASGSGTWGCPACLMTPDGWLNNGQYPPGGSGFYAPGLRAFSLVGRVGSAPPVFVGSGPATLTGSGALTFAVNDDFYGDNEGVGFTVTVVVTRNRAPLADAGADQSIRAGAAVYLNGGGSSDDNTATPSLGYAWTFFAKPTGSVASLSGAATATPSFIADKPGTYQVRLVVTDSSGLASAADEVVISSDNLAPSANAGANQMVVVFSTVNLNGGGSTDPENDPLSYNWSISGPAGSTAVLNGSNSATPNFQPDLPGTYTMTLSVSDFLGAGTPATVQVTAVSTAAYAEQKIMCGANLIAGLGPNQVTTKGNQGALGNFLSEAVKAVQKGQITTAIFKLNEAIERTNGCEVNPGPSPDGNGPGRDWVTDCGVQPPILACLRQARDALMR